MKFPRQSGSIYLKTPTPKDDDKEDIKGWGSSTVADIYSDNSKMQKRWSDSVLDLTEVVNALAGARSYLDFGCGAGREVQRVYSSYKIDVLGFDPSPAMISKAIN